MKRKNLEYESFLSGNRSYGEIIEFLCEEPEEAKSTLRRYDERLEDKDLNIEASPSLYDIGRAFGLYNVVEPFIDSQHEEALNKELDGSDQNELRFLINNSLETIQSECNDPAVDFFPENGVRLDTGNSTLVMDFDEGYEQTIEAPSEYDNIAFYLPDRESTLLRIHHNMEQYEELREEILELKEEYR